MVGCMHRPLGQGQPRAEEGPWEHHPGPPWRLGAQHVLEAFNLLQFRALCPQLPVVERRDQEGPVRPDQYVVVGIQWIRDGGSVRPGLSLLHPFAGMVCWVSVGFGWLKSLCNRSIRKYQKKQFSFVMLKHGIKLDESKGFHPPLDTFS